MPIAQSDISIAHDVLKECRLWPATYEQENYVLHLLDNRTLRFHHLVRLVRERYAPEAREE